MFPGHACANCAAPANRDDPAKCCDFRVVRYFPGFPNRTRYVVTYAKNANGEQHTKAFHVEDIRTRTS